MKRIFNLTVCFGRTGSRRDDGSLSVAATKSFDASNYRGDNETQTVTGRGILQNYGAIVLIPRARLHSGASYEVSIVADGKSYKWTFQVGGH